MLSYVIKHEHKEGTAPPCRKCRDDFQESAGRPVDAIHDHLREVGHEEITDTPTEPEHYRILKDKDDIATAETTNLIYTAALEQD